jgi:hypothetical protein
MKKSIKRMLRDSVASDFESTMQDDLQGVLVIKAFDGEELPSTHIRIATASAAPQRAGKLNLGRWDVTLTISAVTQIDAANSDTHDNLTGAIEAYALRPMATLAAAYSNSEITVDTVYVGNAQEMAIGGMRYSSQELMIECYAK